MGIFSSLFGKKKNASATANVREDIAMAQTLVPEEIFEAATFELQDVLAPSAVEISSNLMKIGDKFAK